MIIKIETNEESKQVMVDIDGDQEVHGFTNLYEEKERVLIALASSLGYEPYYLLDFCRDKEPEDGITGSTAKL